MKKLLVLITILVASFSLSSTSLNATSDFQTHAESKFYKSSWTGNEDYLFFNIDLLEELEFQTGYDILTKKGGQGVEIILTPKEGHELFLPNGKKIQKVLVVILCEENGTSNSVFYSHETTFIYDSGNYKVKTESNISNPPLDLKNNPKFCLTKDSKKGFVEFKNSFPYSQMQ